MCGGCIYVIKKRDTSREYRVGGVEGYRRIGRERETEEVDEGVDEKQKKKTKRRRSGSPLSGPPAARWPAATLHKKL